MANSVEGGTEVNESNINEWFDVDCSLPAFENVTDDEILLRAQGIVDSESEDEEGGECFTDPKVTHSTALTRVDLEGQEDTLLCDKMLLRKIRSTIIKKEELTHSYFIIVDEDTIPRKKLQLSS